MAVYTVHAPPPSAGTRLETAERYVLMPDRFSWPAFWFGPLWMLCHRLWLALLGYVVLVAGLGIAWRVTGGSIAAIIVITFAVALLIGSEAPSLRRFKLQRRGFSLCGVVVGDDREAAERRFFSALAGESKDPRPTPPSAAPAQAGVPDVIGLFPHPGARV
jgi:Protein of unknown function (DUF2628)